MNWSLESERLHAPGLAGVLCAVLVHFHYMQAGLVLVQGLQNHHLVRREESGAPGGTLVRVCPHGAVSRGPGVCQEPAAPGN